MAVTVLVGRTPSLRYDEAISVDEAQMLAQALTLAHYPIPWKSYDPTTSGPLNSAILDLPRFVGMAPTYSTNRLIAVALIVVLLLALYDIIRRSYGELAARLSVLLPLGFFSLETSAEFTTYPTELLSICLIAVATDLVLRALPTTHLPKRAELFASGALLGALPFAKLQALPFVALIFCVALGLILREPLTTRSKIKSVASLLWGALLCPLLILVAVVAAGAFRDFELSYVALPFAYVREHCCHFAGLTFFFGETLFRLFVATSAAIVVVSAAAFGLARLRELPGAFLRPAQTWPAILFVSMLAVAIYATEQPQRDFLHYLLFIVFPLSGIAGSMTGIALRAWRGF